MESVVNVSVKRMATRRVIRWYILSYSDNRKGLTLGLEAELKRRKGMGEPLFEYFSPTFVETKEVDGKLVMTKSTLLYNYFFVKANEDEIFRIKKFQPQYNVFRRVTHTDGTYHFPYVSDDIIRTLQWIARSYSGYLPLYLLDQTLLIKGDRIRITKGPLKGVEAQLVTRPQSTEREVMVFVDNWMCVPLMNVRHNQYEVIRLTDRKKSADNASTLDQPKLREALHAALCRYIKQETTEADTKLATEVFDRFGMVLVDSSIARCKLYSLLLPACTILGNQEKTDGLLKLIQMLLPTVKAESALALITITLYACTDNSFYHDQAHQLVAPWRREENLKKSKQLLLERLAEYDKCLGH